MTRNDRPACTFMFRYDRREMIAGASSRISLWYGRVAPRRARFSMLTSISRFPFYFRGEAGAGLPLYYRCAFTLLPVINGDFRDLCLPLSRYSQRARIDDREFTPVVVSSRSERRVACDLRRLPRAAAAMDS